MKNMREKANKGRNGGAHALRTGVFAASSIVTASALWPGDIAQCSKDLN